MIDQAIFCRSYLSNITPALTALIPSKKICFIVPALFPVLRFKCARMYYGAVHITEICYYFCLSNLLTSDYIIQIEFYKKCSWQGVVVGNAAIDKSCPAWTCQKQRPVPAASECQPALSNMLVPHKHNGSLPCRGVVLPNTSAHIARPALVTNANSQRIWE